jgi:subtilisin family serine protease
MNCTPILIRIPLGLIVLSLMACSRPAEDAEPRPLLLMGPAGQEYAAGQLVVGYGRADDLAGVVKALNATLITDDAQLRAALLGVSGDPKSLVAQAQTLPGVRYAEPNYAFFHRPEGVEPKLETARVRSANAPDQILDELPQYALDPRHLNAKAAWDQGFEGEGVTIAIFDDPADITHPDLADNWVGKAYDARAEAIYTGAAQWKKFAQNSSGFHGTYVSGTMVALKDGKGISGLAPKAKVLPVAIFNPHFIGEMQVAKAIRWATDQGARVHNHSWGGPSYAPQLLKEAFDYALSKGVTIVASAGNRANDQMAYPAGYPGVIASGAAAANRQRAEFSDYGRHLSTLAPGADVLLTRPTWQGGGHQTISGTSFSGPYTAAAAALVLGECPQATPYQVRKVLESTADASVGSGPGFDRQSGWGHLNAGAIAASLPSCSLLPSKGSVVRIDLRLSGQPAPLSNLMLRKVGFVAGSTTDPSPAYWANSSDSGSAWFHQIEPGTYEVYAAGPDLNLTGGLSGERGTFIGLIEAKVGSSAALPDVLVAELKAVGGKG